VALAPLFACQNLLFPSSLCNFSIFFACSREFSRDHHTSNRKFSLALSRSTGSVLPAFGAGKPKEPVPDK
jgi:hypothetical protein